MHDFNLIVQLHKLVDDANNIELQAERVKVKPSVMVQTRSGRNLKGSFYPLGHLPPPPPPPNKNWCV